MADYQLVIHLRGTAEPIQVPMPGVAEADAEADRRDMLYEIQEARLAEAPVIALQTKRGFPAEPLAVDPHEITEIDLTEAAQR